MNDKGEIGIRQGKIALLYWLLSCFFGSIVVVEIERYLFNQIQGFHMPLFMDGIFLWLVLTVFSIAASFPAILTIYLLSKNRLNQRFNEIATSTLLIFYIPIYALTYFISVSFIEAFYLTSPYFLLAFIFKFKYLKLQRPITAHLQ